MPGLLSRREFLAAAAAGCVAHVAAAPVTRGASQAGRLLFTSSGRTGIVNADGGDLRFLRLEAPRQEAWQPAGVFSDGRRLLLMSMEPRQDGPGRPFAEYYHLTPTRLWTYDLDSGALTEIAARDRMAPFYAPQLLLGDDRLLVQVVRKDGAQIYSMNLDGGEVREFTRRGDGFPYGMELSPDRRRVAFHLATSAGYQIWTSDLEGGQRSKVAARDGHLYFAPRWSPDGDWLLFQDCHAARDPGHDWSDVCVCRPNGAEFRVLTSEQAMWFAASYGPPQRRGGGSNTPGWTRDGAILFPRKLPGSKVPWEYQAQRPDTDHFNREYRPDAARGGTEIHRLDRDSGKSTPLTRSMPAVWDFRATESPDGARIAFCRAAVGESPALWVMDADGRNPRLVTDGWEHSGADHPRWLPTLKKPATGGSA